MYGFRISDVICENIAFRKYSDFENQNMYQQHIYTLLNVTMINNIYIYIYIYALLNVDYQNKYQQHKYTLLNVDYQTCINNILT